MVNISEVRFSEFDASFGLKEQRELFLACFPENAGTASESDAHYRWKFHTPFAGASTREYAGTEDGALIAYYAALPYRYSMEGSERLAGMVCDVMTHPRMRGKGVFTKIGGYATAMLAQSGFDFTTGYPIRPEVIPGHLKAGWHIVQRLPLYMKLLRANDLLRSRNIPSALAVPANACLAVGRAFSLLRTARGYSFEILDRPRFLALDDYQDFASRWRAAIKNALIKDFRFWQWRTGAPETSYEFITVRDAQGRLVCTSTVRATVLQDVRTLGVLDLAILPDHLGALASFDAGAREVARRHDSQVVAMMIAPYWAKTYGLWRFGFFPTPAVFSVIVKILNEDLNIKAFEREQDWHLMWIDSDDL